MELVYDIFSHHLIAVSRLYVAAFPATVGRIECIDSTSQSIFQSATPLPSPTVLYVFSSYTGMVVEIGSEQRIQKQRGVASVGHGFRFAQHLRSFHTFKLMRACGGQLSICLPVPCTIRPSRSELHIRENIRQFAKTLGTLEQYRILNYLRSFVGRTLERFIFREAFSQTLVVKCLRKTPCELQNSTYLTELGMVMARVG